MDRNFTGFKITEFYNGRYRGDFVDGKPEGHGVFVDWYGNQYVGEWKNGKREGPGKIYDRNHNLVFKGEFKDDKKNGKGIEVFPGSNEMKIGVWENDCLNKGISYNYPIAKYEGDFEKGLRKGYGILSEAHQLDKKCEELSILINPIEYDYDCIMDNLNRLFEDSTIWYEGFWENSRKHGKGITYFPNGEISYSGEFNQNLKEGHGTSYSRDGQIEYSGFWLKNKRHGPGICYNGQIKRACHFNDDKIDGYALVYNNNILSSKELWNNGRLVFTVPISKLTTSRHSQNKQADVTK